MKILGIDYGEKRVGLAISDETQLIAWELDILTPKAFWEELPKIIKEHELSEIVIGLPLNMSGQSTNKTEEVKQFGNKIAQQTTVPVTFTDERLSSVMASQITGRKSGLDSLAAQIFLQNYLDIKKQK